MCDTQTNWLTSSSLINLSLTGASISCCTWALSSSSRWGVITWSTYKQNIHLNSEDQRKFGRHFEKWSKNLSHASCVNVVSLVWREEERNSSVPQEIFVFSSLAYLQPQLLQLPGFVQQFSLEFSQQQLHFLLLSLFVTLQTLLFTLSTGILIPQAAKRRLWLRLSKVRYKLIHKPHRNREAWCIVRTESYLFSIIWLSVFPHASYKTWKQN